MSPFKLSCFCVSRAPKMGSSVCGTEPGAVVLTPSSADLWGAPLSQPQQCTAKAINPPGQGHRSCLFPRAVLPLLEWKMPDFTRIRNAFTFCVLCLADSPPSYKGHSINQWFQKLQRGFWHRVLAQSSPSRKPHLKLREM